MRTLGEILGDMGFKPKSQATEKIFLPLRSIFRHSAEKSSGYLSEAVIYKGLGIDVTISGCKLVERDFYVLEAIYNSTKDNGRISMKWLLELLALENTPENRTAVINSVERIKHVRICINWYFENTQKFRRPYKQLPIYLIRIASLRLYKNEGLFYFELEPRIDISKRKNYKGLIVKIK